MTFREALMSITAKLAVDTHRNGKVLITAVEWYAIEEELEKRGGELLKLRKQCKKQADELRVWNLG